MAQIPSHRQIIVRGDPDHDTDGLFASQTKRVEARVLKCLPAEFQQQPVLRVHFLSFSRGYTEVEGVEKVDFAQVPPL